MLRDLLFEGARSVGKMPIGSVGEGVVETEVDEKWSVADGFSAASVITLQICDFPSFISRLFIEAAFLLENEMISFRQHNARNNRFGQTFAEAWWAWLTSAEFPCGSCPLFSPRMHPFIGVLFQTAVGEPGRGGSELQGRIQACGCSGDGRPPSWSSSLFTF